MVASLTHVGASVARRGCTSSTNIGVGRSDLCARGGGVWRSVDRYATRPAPFAVLSADFSSTREHEEFSGVAGSKLMLVHTVIHVGAYPPTLD